MSAKILAWNGSAAVRLPNNFLNKLNLRIGQEIDVTIFDGALIIKPVKKKYTLSELVAQCDDKAERDADSGIWPNSMKPVGKEIW